MIFVLGLILNLSFLVPLDAFPDNILLFEEEDTEPETELSASLFECRRALVPRNELVEESPEEWDGVPQGMLPRSVLNRLYPTLVGYCYHLASNRLATGTGIIPIEDLISKIPMIFFSGYYDRDHGTSDKAVLAYFRRALKNRFIELIRKKQHPSRPRVSLDTENDEFGDPLPIVSGIWNRSTEARDPARVAVINENYLRSIQAISLLSENHRSTFILHDIAHLSHRVGAAVFEIPEGTMMSRTYHARKKLGTLLEEGELHLSLPDPKLFQEIEMRTSLLARDQSISEEVLITLLRPLEPATRNVLLLMGLEGYDAFTTATALNLSPGELTKEIGKAEAALEALNAQISSDLQRYQAAAER